MFFDTASNNHGLRHNPLKSCVVPRPIAWISTLNNSGKVNLAPFSYFNLISDLPPMVMFAGCNNINNEDKDTIFYTEQNKEFVVNIVSFDFCEDMVNTSKFYNRNISETEELEIEIENSNFIKTPRVKNIPIALECKYFQTISLPHTDKLVSNKMVLGTVEAIYIDDKYIIDGKLDITKVKPVTRLGYDQYAVIENYFVMKRFK